VAEVVTNRSMRAAGQNGITIVISMLLSVSYHATIPHVPVNIIAHLSYSIKNSAIFLRLRCPLVEVRFAISKMKGTRQRIVTY
jgi:hypothetical protein